MRLEVADQLVRLASRLVDPAWVETEVEERLVQRDPVAVAQVPPVLEPVPGDGLGAEQRGAEARALLVAEADQLQGEGELDVVQPLGHGDRHDDPEHPVVGAGVRHGVEVGAEQQRGQPRLAPLAPAAHVAGGVDPGAQPGVGHPAGDHLVGLGVLAGQVGPLEVDRVGGVAVELVAAVEHQGRVAGGPAAHE